MNNYRGGVYFLTAIIVSAAAVILLSAPLYAQTDEIDMDRVYADRELEFGVRAFHSGEFNRAIQSFEEALAYKQDFSMARRWLAEAYYRSGFVSPALDMWRQIINSDEATSTLESKVRTIEYRRSLDEDILDDPEFVSLHTIDAEADGSRVFNRPTSVVPTEDGGFYLVSFGSNEILKFNSNGGMQNRLRGGLEGLNRPFDLVINSEGDIFVSEFEGDRIVKLDSDGRNISRFGGTGTGEGELLGPQYMSDDGKGYIYVTDQGNRRVVKFDYDGNFALSFGRKSSSFEGFEEPTGIFYYRERVYVTDKIRGDMTVFDESGNYIGSYGSDVLNEPEGISLFRDGELILADRSRVYRFNIDRERFDLLKEVEGSNVDILKAVRDVNDNLLSVEFDRNAVNLFSNYSRMYSGLHVDIKRVRAEDFPRVLVEVEVTRREGPAYVGLMQNNFFITEGRYPAENLELLYTVDERRETDVTLMVERSDLLQGEGESVSQAVTELIDALDGDGSLKIVSAGENPVVQEEGTLSVDRAQTAAAKDEHYSSGWSFDIGARLSASTLSSTDGRRAVVFLGSGSLPNHAFDEYALSDVLSYFKNNDITFYCVTLEQYESIDSELKYLCEQTGGEDLYLYRSEGIGEILEMERSASSGRYFMTFDSRIESEFGRNYMPVEVQTSIFGRSGRAESGYYGEPEM
ncbi:MAG: hypothetical protein R6V67_12290 [Spirochaetia bacterium]